MAGRDPIRDILDLLSWLWSWVAGWALWVWDWMCWVGRWVRTMYYLAICLIVAGVLGLGLALLHFVVLPLVRFCWTTFQYVRGRRTLDDTRAAAGLAPTALPVGVRSPWCAATAALTLYCPPGCWWLLRGRGLTGQHY